MFKIQLYLINDQCVYNVNKTVVPSDLHRHDHVKWFFFLLCDIQPSWYHHQPRPQVAHCWRNIDYLNVSLWTKSLGVAQRALFLSPFLSPTLSVSTHPLSILRVLLQACSDLHLLLAQTFALSLKDFFLFLYDQAFFIHPDGLYRTSMFLGYAVVAAEAGEDRETYHRWKEVWRRCGTDDWTLWALTQRSLLAPAQRASFCWTEGRQLRWAQFGTTKGTVSNLSFCTNIQHPLRYFPTRIPQEDVTFSFAHRRSVYPRSKPLLLHQLLDLDMSFKGLQAEIIVRDRAGLWDYCFDFFICLSKEEVLCCCSMASVSRLARRKDASRWPRMSSTFWAVVLLTALLVLYCGKCRCSSSDHTYRHLEALITGAGAHREGGGLCHAGTLWQLKWCHWYWQSLLLIPHVVDLSFSFSFFYLNRYWREDARHNLSLPALTHSHTHTGVNRQLYTERERGGHWIRRKCVLLSGKNTCFGQEGELKCARGLIKSLVTLFLYQIHTHTSVLRAVLLSDWLTGVTH